MSKQYNSRTYNVSKIALTLLHAVNSNGVVSPKKYITVIFISSAIPPMLC